MHFGAKEGSVNNFAVERMLAGIAEQPDRIRPDGHADVAEARLPHRQVGLVLRGAGEDAGDEAALRVVLGLLLGDAAGVVLRHVQVGTDEYALAAGLAVGAKVGEAKDMHGWLWREWKSRRIVGGVVTAL